MTKKEIEARRAYKREWNRKHPGKQTEYSMRYWAKKIRDNEAKAEAETAEGEQGVKS